MEKGRNLVFHANLIDRQFHLTSEILIQTGDKSLREEEGRQPERPLEAIGAPVGYELHSFY